MIDNYRATDHFERQKSVESGLKNAMFMQFSETQMPRTEMGESDHGSPLWPGARHVVIAARTPWLQAILARGHKGAPRRTHAHNVVQLHPCLPR